MLFFFAYYYYVCFYFARDVLVFRFALPLIAPLFFAFVYNNNIILYTRVVCVHNICVVAHHHLVQRRTLSTVLFVVPIRVDLAVILTKFDKDFPAPSRWRVIKLYILKTESGISIFRTRLVSRRYNIYIYYVYVVTSHFPLRGRCTFID